MQQRPKPQTEPVTVVLARGALDADSYGGGIGTGHLLAFLPLCRPWSARAVTTRFSEQG